MSDFTDFYGIEQLLTDAGRDAVQRTRDFMAKEVEPVINRLWTREEFPFELIPGIAALGITGVAYEGYGCPGGGPLLDGVLAMEIARSDPSMSTFMGVHSGLAMGSVYLCGSPEQKERWLPPMARLEKIGAFGLTEPDVGSGVAGGLTTTARREGDEWVIDGQKKWIGNATFADYIIIWARDLADGQVKGFVVEKGTPGLSTTKIKDKIALRGGRQAPRRPGADVRLGQPERADLLKPRHRRQPALLLLFGAAQVHRPHRQAAVHAHERGHRRVRPGDLHRQHAVEQRAAAGTAVALVGDPGDAEAGEPGYELVRELLAGPQPVDDRLDLLSHEVPGPLHGVAPGVGQQLLDPVEVTHQVLQGSVRLPVRARRPR